MTSWIEQAADSFFFEPLQHAVTGRALVTGDHEQHAHDPNVDGGGLLNPLNMAAKARDWLFGTDDFMDHKATSSVFAGLFDDGPAQAPAAEEKPAGPAPVNLVADDEKTPQRLAAERAMQDEQARKWMEQQRRDREAMQQVQEEERRREAERRKNAEDERKRMKAQLTPLG